MLEWCGYDLHGGTKRYAKKFDLFWTLTPALAATSYSIYDRYHLQL